MKAKPTSQLNKAIPAKKDSITKKLRKNQKAEPSKKLVKAQNPTLKKSYEYQTDKSNTQTDEDNKAMEKVWTSNQLPIPTTQKDRNIHNNQTIRIEVQFASKDPLVKERLKTKPTSQLNKAIPAKKDSITKKLQKKQKAEPHKKLVKAQNANLRKSRQDKENKSDRLNREWVREYTKTHFKPLTNDESMSKAWPTNQRLSNASFRLSPDLQQAWLVKDLRQVCNPNSSLLRSKM